MATPPTAQAGQQIDDRHLVGMGPHGLVAAGLTETDRRPEPAAAGMGRVFRFQSVARVRLAGRLDTATAALRRLGPVEDARQALQGAQTPEGLREGGQCGQLQPEGTVAAELVERSASRLHQQTLQGTWAALDGGAGERVIRRTAVVRTRMPGGVGGVVSRDTPLSRFTGGEPS